MKNLSFQIASTSSAKKTRIVPLRDDENLSKNLDQIAQLIGVSATALSNDFKASKKEFLMLYSTQKPLEKIYLLGLGKKPTSADALLAMRSFFYKHKKKITSELAIDFVAGETENFTESIINGLLLSNYEISHLKTDEKAADVFSELSVIEIIASTKKQAEVLAAAEVGKATAETQMRCLRLVDLPANFKTPEQLAAFALASGNSFGYEVSVYDEKQCEQMGLHALLAVGRGSVDNPARFIVMEYRGKNASANSVGLVGKGVTFDTGGVSLKPGEGMNYMKSDMGGAAAVLGTMELAAKLHLPVHLIGIVPATENCIDALAIKPGDVINSYAGKTIEVINTDAEGRLILADGLHYMKKNFNPTVMIDLATLTGSCIRTLGYAAAGLMTNNDALAEELYNAGQISGEKLWRLPLWDDYADMMKSDVADIKNLSTAPLAGATTAAKFLEAFVDEHSRWAHLDIAGTAFGDSEFGSMKSATAFGIRLLMEWLRGQMPM